jgi:hypothetical protein
MSVGAHHNQIRTQLLRALDDLHVRAAFPAVGVTGDAGLFFASLSSGRRRGPILGGR